MKVLQKNNKAFKEWAVVVDALGSGRQTLIFRKGGISETTGEFEIEAREFFLFPTYEHQNKEELISGVHARLDQLTSEHVQDGKIHIQYYASVQNVYKITELEKLKKLEGHHIWTPSLIEERFNWGKEKFLYCLILRVFQLPQQVTVPFKQEYGGCKSWVNLDVNFSTEGNPVLSNTLFHQEKHAIEKILEPSENK